MQTHDALLSRNLRLHRSSLWYSLAALTVLVGFCSIPPFALADQRYPPSDAALRRSLLLDGGLQVIALRIQLAKPGPVTRRHGLYFRAPSCAVQGITNARVLHHAGGNITGMLQVDCVWVSPTQRTFASREEAASAKLRKEEPGKLRLTFMRVKGEWVYKGMKKD